MNSLFRGKQRAQRDSWDSDGDGQRDVRETLFGVKSAMVYVFVSKKKHYDDYDLRVHFRNTH